MSQIDLFSVDICPSSSAVQRARNTRFILGWLLSDVSDRTSRTRPSVLSALRLHIEVMGGLGGAW
ncbi:hypothetical protein RIE95_05920 [Acidithiobacillus thiooxidans]|uniref:hypothetical protein n=1 Tax=Acidithiobacillus thiooxidans TaxID=930 RepID=UPI002858B5E9|nr:hypothetical protein [Acidithiobacillus thiooxidans]MDR7926529.1 hypothetical protein [Acidithiobacillus thiooxidans]